MSEEKAEWYCGECGTELKGFTCLWDVEIEGEVKEYWAGYCPRCKTCEGVELWQSDYMPSQERD